VDKTLRQAELSKVAYKNKNKKIDDIPCSGLRAVHKRIVDCVPLQLDQAIEMVEAPFDVEVKRPFGEEIAPEPEKGRAGGDPSKAGSSKRPAGGEPEGPAEKKARQDARSEKGKHNLSHDVSYRKYGGDSAPDLINLLFENAAAANGLAAGKQGLREEFCKLCSKALSRRTWAKYGSAFNKWVVFAKERGKDVFWPITEAEKIAFVCWCSKKGNLAPDTVKSYLGILENLENLFGGPDRNQEELKKFLLKGVERGKTGTVLEKRTVPVTLEVLETIHQNIIKKRWKKLSRLAIWGACTLAYWGVFRIGELLPARKVKFDELSDLLWKDIHFSKRGLSVTIKSPKVVGREAETVYLHRLKEKWICPVRALKKLKNRVGGADKPEMPVFQLRPGINLTRKVFLDSVNRLLEGSKFQGKEIQGKSFRSGIPSEIRGRIVS
jgi:hypothetical protein